MKTAIYGIGNVLMGDDGIGPAVVRDLSSNYTLPPDTTLEDLGTPSLDLPAYLAGYDRVIFIDAVARDAPPGTVRVFSRDEITSVPTGIRVSPHEPTINDALIVLDFAGTAPREVVLVGVVPETLEGGMTLSPRVAGAVGRARDVAVKLIGPTVATNNEPRLSSQADVCRVRLIQATRLPGRQLTASNIDSLQTRLKEHRLRTIPRLPLIGARIRVDRYVTRAQILGSEHRRLHTMTITARAVHPSRGGTDIDIGRNLAPISPTKFGQLPTCFIQGALILGEIDPKSVYA